MISAPAVEAGDALSGARGVRILGRRLLRDRSAPETAQAPPRPLSDPGGITERPKAKIE